MKTLLILISLLFSITISAQTFKFKKTDFKFESSLSGEYAEYRKYELPTCWFFNGFNNKNLSFMIMDKESRAIIYEYPRYQTDAMILKPTFFCNQDSSTVVILVEVATEYSWGQEVLILKENKIKYIGFLDYMADTFNYTSIANYCHISNSGDKILMEFDDIPIIHFKEESKRIMGKNLMFDITNKIIRLK